MSAAWPVLTTRKKIGMNIVMNSASGWRIASRSGALPERDRGAHARHLLDLAGGALAGAARGVEEDVVERRLLVAAAALAQVGLERLGGALADDQAAVDDREPVAELVGLLEVLGGEEDRRPVAR